MGNSMVKMEVVGDEALQAAMLGLGRSSQARVARPAIREASTPIVRQMRQNAPKKQGDRTGQLRKSIGRRMVTYKNSGTVIAVIGPRRNFTTNDKFGNKVDPSNYAHLVEFGTYRSTAKPFMRPAWEENKSKARRTLRNRMWIELKKEAERVRRKAAAKAAKR